MASPRRCQSLLLALAMACCLQGTQGLWPKPEAVTKGSRTLYASILKSTPLGIGDKDDVISDGFAYALEVEALEEEAEAGQQELRKERRHKRCHVIRTVEVSVTSSDQSLTLETRESYSLSIEAGAIQIQANSVFGALRAMESLAQLVRRRMVEEVERAASGFSAGSEVQEGFVPEEAMWADSGSKSGKATGTGATEPEKPPHATVLLVDEVDIYDAPRFRYRGLLIDTARHFLPISVIKEHLDAMAMVKMNCLHWHLTDDESFPWLSEELPELAGKGAFAPEAVYTSKDIREVVEYARFRGIRVIPELDMPGHTQSWGKAYPGLLTQCFDTDTVEPTGRLGPINPARNETFGFIWRLLREVARTFPDPYIHLGGDEVDHVCWKSNPEVQEFMQQHDFASVAKLEAFFMAQVVRLASTAGKAAIVWQEAFDQGVPLPPYTRVQVWKWWKEQGQETKPEAESSSGSTGGGAAISMRGRAAAGGGMAAARRRALLEHPQGRCDPGFGCENAAGDDDAWKAELQAVTGHGYDAILSAPWYLNLGSYAGQEWQRYYAVDPTDFQGTTEQKDRVLGGTACAWGEFIDAVNSVNRVWPRAAAVSERLWSPADATNVDEAAARLADLRCRMLSRGIAAQSTGPGFCPGELTTRM
ncbi:hypothetical protein CHLNCDRAFT_58755 [Chlorella variabilis]|uniref:Beta-hexosaminidase n=1 Tax=Chlorella variabilis TaxID=554065 RepID=E1ZMZ8_CHLVA|nr:hypothetical protein CHLNCDRAFT_58755 [Chlorella variabilis]EFN52781.1 hypothetical protein CHLNCDRAFT_58755 [Chlorella variabilis]|eukprot:XP_005844883.1 hypothetical protein CHLNCDRAFT_58755 [Chlorella variabilis]